MRLGFRSCNVRAPPLITRAGHKIGAGHASPTHRRNKHFRYRNVHNVVMMLRAKKHEIVPLLLPSNGDERQPAVHEFRRERCKNIARTENH